MARDSKPETAAQLAKKLGVSRQTLQTWFRRGCPRSPFKSIELWRDEHVLPRRGGPRKDPEEADPRGLRARRLVAEALKCEEQARRAKMENDLREGQLIERADVTRRWAEQFAPARAILDALPDQVAKELPRELRVSAYNVVRAAIDRSLRSLAALGDEAESPEPSAEPRTKKPRLRK